MADHPEKYRYTIVNKETGKAIPEDEPVFILRAQDKLAARVIRFYAELLADNSAIPGGGVAIDHVLEHAGEFDAWPTKKMPD